MTETSGSHSRPPKVIWRNAAVDTFTTFKEDLGTFLGSTVRLQYNTGWVIKQFNEFDVAEPAGAAGTAGARAKIDHIATVTIMLRNSVTKPQLKQIMAKLSDRNQAIYDGVDDDQLPGAAPINPDTGDPDPTLDPSNKAEALWTAFVAFSKGALSELTGDLLDDARDAWTFPTTGSWAERVDEAIGQLQDFVDQATNLGDPMFPFTDAHAVRLYRRKMKELDPGRYEQVRTSYENIRTLHALQARALIDAHHFDSADSTFIDPGARALAAAFGISAAELARVACAPAGTDRNHQLRVLIGNVGDDNGESKFKCSFHNTNDHSDAECRRQHPELQRKWESQQQDRRPDRGQQRNKKNRSLPKTPTDKSKPKQLNKYFVVGDDGKLQSITPEGITAGRTMVTHLELENAMAAGAADNIDANGAIFIDNCADRSFANSFAGLTDIRAIPDSTRRPFNGIGDDAVIPTHTATRTINLTDSIQYSEQVLIGGRYNITCTSAMANHGISTLTEASEGGQLYLLCDGQAIQATRIGNIYAVPSSCKPKVASPHRKIATTTQQSINASFDEWIHRHLTDTIVDSIIAHRPDLKKINYTDDVADVVARVISGDRATGGTAALDIIDHDDIKSRMALKMLTLEVISKLDVAGGGDGLAMVNVDHGSSTSYSIPDHQLRHHLVALLACQCHHPPRDFNHHVFNDAVDSIMELGADIVHDLLQPVNSEPLSELFADIVGRRRALSNRRADHSGRRVAAAPGVKLDPEAIVSDVAAERPRPGPTTAQRYKHFRMWMGNPGHKATMTMAKNLGARVTSDPDACAQLDRTSRIANMRSKPLVKVEPSGITATPLTRIVTDTIGSEYPTAADGKTKTVQTWADPTDPEMYHVTFGSDHKASTSWAGLLQYARERGLILHTHMLNSGVVIYCDGGSEYLGEFQESCNNAGIIINKCTANAKDGLNQIAEGVNARAQQHARVNMVNAAAHFNHLGFDIRKYWPHAYSFSALQNRARALVNRGEMNFDQFRRAVPAPFGAYGNVVLQPGDPVRRHDHKQLAPRGTMGLLVGMDGHKSIMLLPNGELHSTYAVIFDHRAPWGSRPVPLGTIAPSRNRAKPRADANTPSLDLDRWLDHVFASDVPASGGHHDATVDGGGHDATVDGGVTHTNSDEHEPTFIDADGSAVAVGDRIEVLWPTEGATFPGTVTEIDASDSTYHVIYDDGDSQWHLADMSDSSAPEVHRSELNVAASVRKSRWQRRCYEPSVCGLTLHGPRFTPHHTVSQYVDDNGDILADVLLGNRALPPPPPFPLITPGTQPEAPTTVTEALASELAIFWLHAIVAEFIGHVNPSTRPPTWNFTTERPSRWSLRSKWVFVIKWDGERIDKFKARLCVTGHSLTRDVDYIESYCGAAYSSDNRMLEALAIQCDWLVYEDDLSQAFVQFRMPPSPDGKSVIMAPAKGTRISCADGGFFNKELVMSLYGHPASGWALATGICNRLTNRQLTVGQRPCPLHFTQCDAQPVIYRAMWPVGHKWYNERFILTVNTDNLRVFSSCDEIYQQYRDWLVAEFTITGTGRPLRESAPTSTMGKVAHYGEDYVRLDMPGFQQKIIAAAGLTDAKPAPTPMIAGFRLTKDECPGDEHNREQVRVAANSMFPNKCADWASTLRLYRSLVANLNWMAKECAPILSASVAMFSRVMHDPPTSAFRAVHRAYRYLVGQPNLGITYQRSRIYDFRNGDYPSWTISSDATLGDDLSTGKPLGGAGGGFTGMALDFWFSHTARRVCGSTLAAESYFGSAAARQAAYMQMILIFLDVYDGQPLILNMDNETTVLHAGAPIKKWSAKSRHFTLDQKYVAQAVQDNVIQVRHQRGTATDDNPRGFYADAFTKGLPRDLVELYLGVMHGPSVNATNGGE